MAPPPLRDRYRHGLRKAVGTSAGPYGYTLTVWTTGAVLIHARGVPTTLEALLFMFGAVVGFAAVGALAFRSELKVRARSTSHPVLWGSFHFVPVAASVAVASLVAHLVEGASAWPLAGFTATAIYLTCVAAQITFFEEQVFEDLEQEVGEIEREVVEDL
ncbi:MAG TPA: hypothetical protein VG898_02075 [Solirubrobacterales bacterium]|nr:hypothetical protein [Solirubrobacterales bacterium]